MAILNVILEHKFEIISGLWMLSEALAFIPSVKANSVFQAVSNGLKSLREKLGSK